MKREILTFDYKSGEGRWCAYFAGNRGPEGRGWGATEQDAINDLLSLYAETDGEKEGSS